MKNRAFTLPEFIIAIAIIGIIAGIGMPLMVEISEGWLLHTRRKEISESARIAMERMATEIRKVRDRNSFVTVAGDTLRFVDISNQDITFTISGTSLSRIVNGVSNALADNVSTLSFTYYDSFYATIPAPVADPTQIRMITIDLTFSLTGAQLTIRSQVSPRRLQ